MRPLVRLQGTDLYLESSQERYDGKTLSEVRKRIVPSLQLVGLQSEERSLEELQEICKSELKIKEPVVGEKGKYQQKGKVVQLRFVKREELVLVETVTTVVVTYSQASFDVKQLQKAVNLSLEGAYVFCDDKIVKENVDPAEGNTPKRWDFIVPEVKVTSPFDTRFQGQIPIKFYLTKEGINKTTLLGTYCRQLLSSLKIVIKNKLPYRQINIQNGILLQDYSNKVSNHPTSSSLQPQPQVDSPPSQPASSSKTWLVLSGLLLLCLLYVLAKSVV